MAPIKCSVATLLAFSMALLSTPVHSQSDWLVVESAASVESESAVFCTGNVLSTNEGPNEGKCFTTASDPPACLHIEETPNVPRKICGIYGFPLSRECIGETDIIGFSDDSNGDVIGFDSVNGPYRSFFVSCSLESKFPPLPPNGTGLP